MGYVDSKPRIIEFNGLPGTGKTTISQLLKQRIEKEYCQVDDKYYRHKYQKTPYSLFLSPEYYNRIIKYYNYSKSFESQRPLIYSLIPLKYIRMYNQFVRDEKKSVLIIDQGFIQGLISLAHIDILPKQDFLSNLLTHSGLNELPFVSINCSCCIEKTIERLLNRQDQKSRLQQKKGDELIKAMKVQYMNLNTLRAKVTESCPRIQSIEIDTELSPDYNVNNIIDKLQLY